MKNKREKSTVEVTETQGKVRRTKLYRSGDPSAIPELARYLNEGELVVFPTDTVYGLGANAFDATAIARLFAVKQRPNDKGIPVLMADIQDLERVAASIPPAARLFIERFWPGPLSLIVPRQPALPDVLSPNGSVAVRIPNHPVARELIRAAGGAIATTSANLSGYPPATNGMEALAVLGGLVAAIIDDGPSPGPLASTVVDCTQEKPIVLRTGPLSARDLGVGEPHSGQAF